MHRTTRLRRIESALKPPVTTSPAIIQIVGVDGTAKPTDEEVAERSKEWEAEDEGANVIRLVRVEIVNSPHTQHSPA